MAEPTYKVLTFRGAELPDQYLGLVVSRWVRTLKYGSDWFKLVDPASYWRSYPPFIASILQRPNTIVKIAVIADDPDVAFAFAVLEAEALHYVHVQKDGRRQGIATEILKNLSILKVTHLTRTGVAFWVARLSTAKFDPFVA